MNKEITTRQGFKNVGIDVRKRVSAMATTLLVEIEAITSLSQKEFARGTDLLSSKKVNVTLANGRKSHLSLSDIQQQVSEDGLFVFTHCTANRNGVWEARSCMAFERADLVWNKMVRVGAPYEKDDGRWSQAVQMIEQRAGRRVSTFSALVETVHQTLNNMQPGRTLVTIYAKDHSKEDVYFDIPQAFDSEEYQYMDGASSLDLFLATPDIWVGGLNVKMSGVECLNMIKNHLSAEQGNYCTLFSKQCFNMSGVAAQRAGLGTGKDLSNLFRFSSLSTSTGYLPAILGLHRGERSEVWPRYIQPIGKSQPLSSLNILAQLSQTSFDIAESENEREIEDVCSVYPRGESEEEKELRIY